MSRTFDTTGLMRFFKLSQANSFEFSCKVETLITELNKTPWVSSETAKSKSSKVGHRLKS
jgi:hypothetical protein